MQRWPFGPGRAIALGFCLCLAAPPAHAFQFLGLKLFERNNAQNEEAIGEPQPYTVDFVVEDGSRKLTEALKNASTLWAERKKPASGEAGLIARARGDYRRLLDALYGEARYGGTISITIDGREVAQLAPDTTLADPAAVDITVDPGPLFHFGEARVVNPAPAPTGPHDEVPNPADNGFAPGEVARSGTIIRAERLAVDAWRQQGHAKAEVVQRRVVAAHRTSSLDATLEVDPGRKARYSPVAVKGTRRLDPAFIAYMTDLPPGEEYDPDDIEQANKRLARLDVFRSVRIEEGDKIGPEGILPIEVVVQERLPRRFGVGGSYSTVDGLGLEAYWLHRNLFGRAERLRFDGKIAGIGKTIDPSDFTYQLTTTFTKPGAYTPDTDFIASLSGKREVLEPYTRTGTTAEAGFKHQFTRELSGRAFVTAGYDKFNDDFGIRHFLTAGMAGALTYDSRDDPADATEGFFLEATAQPFYEFHYGNAAARLTAEGRAYYGFGEEKRVVLAGRLKLGSLPGPSIAEAPPDRLFFAGGGGSVRGYAYRNIGVPTANGVSGGRSLIEASVELRVRVTQTIGVVGFMDAGYVGAEPIPDFNEDLRVGAGAGLRYLTGLGPIRIDAAVPLDARPGDPSIAFYVGIGQAF